MNISLSTWMMIFFILSLVLSIWKIYAFLPNKELEDDDKTKNATKELTKLMLSVIKKNQGNMSDKELFHAMKNSPRFNEKKFWRFNLNRLKQLLNQYYINNSNTNSIKNIYKQLI